MRRRRSLLFVAIAAVLLLLLSWLLDLLGGSSRQETPQEAARMPPPPPPVERPEAPPAATLEGQVLDEAGIPLADAAVHLVVLDEGERREADLRTDAEGRFSDGSIVRGKLIFVEVRKGGHPTIRQRPRDIAIGREPLRLDLRFPATFDLRGHVIEAGRGAVAGALVSLGDLYQATSDDRGLFHIVEIDSGILRGAAPPLRTRAEGYEDSEQDLRLDSPHANFDDIEVVLERRER